MPRGRGSEALAGRTVSALLPVAQNAITLRGRCSCRGPLCPGGHHPALRRAQLPHTTSSSPARVRSFRGKTAIAFASSTLAFKGAAKFGPPTKAAPGGEIIVTLEAAKGGAAIGATTASGDPKKLSLLVSRLVAWATAAESRANSATPAAA